MAKVIEIQVSEFSAFADVAGSLEDVCWNAVGDPSCCFAEGVARQMSVARRCLDPAVAEERSDRRQAVTERESPGREGAEVSLGDVGGHGDPRLGASHGTEG